MHAGGTVGLVVDVQFAQGALDERFLVIGVEDDEIGAEGELGRFAPQQAGAHGVKGSQPDALEALVDHVDHAAFHLARGFVGEGDGDDVVSRDALAVDEVSQAAREHTRLARTGSGQHEHLPVTSGDGLALLRVEIIQQMVGHGSVHLGGRIEAEIVDAIEHRVFMLAAAAAQQGGCILQRGAAGRAGKERAFRSGRCPPGWRG